MLKMIIADDEEIVRDGLKNIIPWQEFGIEIIGEASDGEEAYELCRELKPDILFTDIRMPLLDGLEVAMKLKEEKRDIKVIIISGIQDFNYAKTALDLDAEGYILKPVKINELKGVINRVANSINMRRNREEEMLILKKQLIENIPLMQENFIRDLVFDAFYDEQEIIQKLKYFNIPFKMDENATAAALEIDDYREIVRSYQEEGRQLLNLLVYDVTKKIVTNCSSGMCVHTGENKFIIIFNLKTQLEKRHIGICEEIMSCVKELAGVTVSIGLGRSADRFCLINVSYREALEALKYKFYTGNNSLLNINDFIGDTNDFNYSHLLGMEKQLIDCIKLGDGSKVSQVLDDMLDPLYTDIKASSAYLQSICMEIICILSRLAYEFNEDIDTIVTSHSRIFDNILLKENMYDLKNYILSILLKVTEHINKKYKKKNEETIKKIMQIINEKYMEDLSIFGISEEVHLTPNYVSLIFRRETNITVTDYITGVRILKAKELLMTTDLQVQKIAEMVGYDNPHYFSTVFKKQTGIHPMKYRSLTSN